MFIRTFDMLPPLILTIWQESQIQFKTSTESEEVKEQAQITQQSSKGAEILIQPA